ncbi:MAG: hypothetical protein QGG50_02580 [Methanopyri archaeon]|jgi:hypothetical protein|nr:hypothetical protein [Methanopyri archaeon]|tara:strand:+ start:147 stop:620 length:474 start_codon:yes stop_codon:yes gene_type:complete
MEIILDYATHTFMSFENEFGNTEQGWTLYEARLNQDRAHDVAELVSRYSELPEVEASGELQDFVSYPRGIKAEKEVYRVTLSGDEVDVQRFLEDVKDLGYGTPEKYGPASISTDDADVVRERLTSMVKSLETHRTYDRWAVVETPEGPKRGMAVRWE